MAPGEPAAPVGAAGLEQDRGALRGRLGQVDALHADMRAVVPHGADAGRVGVEACGLVAADGVVGPASLPELGHGFEVIVGDVVAAVVRGLPPKSHCAGGAVEIAGDDVPADAAPGQVVERGDAAGEGVGRLVAEVRRHAEAEGGWWRGPWRGRGGGGR